MHYPLVVILVCVRWCAADALSFRNVEEMTAERRVLVDRLTLHRCAIKWRPLLADVGRRRKRSVGNRWRMDDPYVKDAGQWKYLNNIVEKDHRALKQISRSMIGFKRFRCARILISDIETMHMIRKGQLGDIKDQASSATNQFYSLVFLIGV